MTIGGGKVLEGASGAVLTGALTDVSVQGLEGVTEGKPFSVGEVVMAGTLAGAGHLAGEEIGALVNKGVPKQDVPRQQAPRQVDLSFELEQHPDQVALAARHVENWGRMDMAGHTSALHAVTFEGGGRGYFKPYTGEDTAGRESFRQGSLWRNEVGVHEVDEALGLKLTAITTAVEAPVGPHGELIRGSLADSVGSGYRVPIPTIQSISRRPPSCTTSLATLTVTNTTSSHNQMAVPESSMEVWRSLTGRQTPSGRASSRRWWANDWTSRSSPPSRAWMSSCW
jgi:hypothetical protein